MATEQDRGEPEGVLSTDVVASNKVQERDGSFHVTIPKDSARDLGIEKGDRVLFTGRAGEDRLEVQKPDRILSADD